MCIVCPKCGKKSFEPAEWDTDGEYVAEDWICNDCDYSQILIKKPVLVRVFENSNMGRYEAIDEYRKEVLEN